MVKISVVTISYNQAQFLKQTIKSVFSQDYEHIEYIIVDAGSTDGSRRIIEDYASHIQKIVFEPDLGPPDGLNKGFAVATGDVFGYINSDDILLPGALTKVADYFQTHGEIDVLMGNVLRLDSNSAVIRKQFSDKWDLRRYAYRACVIAQQANFFRKRAFENAGGFNVANLTCWDGELLVDMSISGARFFKIDDFLGGFRIYPETITCSGRLNTKLKKDQRRIFMKIMGRGHHWYDEVPRFFYRTKRKLTLIGKQMIEEDPHWITEVMSLFYRTK